jgi:predicted nucleotidyltransferase component of viral defense system
LIPPAYINAWAAQAPWPNDADIEQDLILSRLMIEIANDDLLGPELAMRGGTCLHKLYLPEPLRYSEDLDYVRTT